MVFVVNSEIFVFLLEYVKNIVREWMPSYKQKVCDFSPSFCPVAGWWKFEFDLDFVSSQKEFCSIFLKVVNFMNFMHFINFRRFVLDISIVSILKSNILVVVPFFYICIFNFCISSALFLLVHFVWKYQIIEFSLEVRMHWK